MANYHDKRWTIVLYDGRPLRKVSFDNRASAWSFISRSRLGGARPVPPVSN